MNLFVSERIGTRNIIMIKKENVMDNNGTILINDYDKIEDFEIKCLQNILAKVTSEVMNLENKDADQHIQYSDIALRVATKIQNLKFIKALGDDDIGRLANRYISEHPEEFDLDDDYQGGMDFCY